MYFLRKKGAIRELNPGPLVPKTRIIPLDQSPSLTISSSFFFSYSYIWFKFFPQNELRQRYPIFYLNKNQTFVIIWISLLYSNQLYDNFCSLEKRFFPSIFCRFFELFIESISLKSLISSTFFLKNFIASKNLLNFWIFYSLAVVGKILSV